MRLSHQLFAGSALVFLVVLAVVFGSHVETSRAYLEKQLASHAQDAATSLAVAMTASLRENGTRDMALAGTTVSAVFSRGYYRRIALLDQQGKALIERNLDSADGPQPPQWLRALFPFDMPRRTALVTAGWRQLGQIEVESSPEFAYRQLEDFAATAALWLAVAYVLTLLFLRLLLDRVLDPLRRIEAAAGEIAQRRFRQISPLPATRELRRVVEGFNRLSSTVAYLLDEEERRAERFRRLAYTDQLVGLPNRVSLVARLDVLAEEMRSDAALALVDINGLGGYNVAHSYPDGDATIAALARVLAEVAGENFCARLQGGCFAVLLTGCDEAAARVFGEQLGGRLAEAIHTLDAWRELDFAIGISPCTLGASASALLAAADTTLASARHRRPGAVVVDWQGALPAVASEDWQRRIHRALDNHRFVLVGQGVFSVPATEALDVPTLLHSELFARLQLDDGSELAAGQFIPMAARYGLLEAIDRACLDLLFAALLTAPQGGRYSFNLSAEALRRPAFTGWLLDRLAGLGTGAGALIFEVSDFVAQAVTGELADFSRQIRKLGATLTIDQFGLSAGSFQRLRTVLPDYVKLAGSLVHDVVQGDEKHFYLESICNVAVSLSIPVIATCVECSGQLPMLRKLGVHAVQGNALAPAQPLFRPPVLN
jgi:diguanylate cyclase (GGDEF)-like protein